MQVFLSHAPSEKEFAIEVGSRLSEEGFDVFNPLDDVARGENAFLKIGRALEKSKAMVVFLSPESMKSAEVQQEIDFALVSPQFAHRLFPVVVRPVRQIPWILKKMPLVRVGRRREQAADQIVELLRQAPQG